jgi:hypothetical protein
MEINETYTETLQRTAREYDEAKAACDAWYEDAWRAVYAEERARDKAAGKDVSGKSVASRRCYAMTHVGMSPEWKAYRDRVEAFRAEYKRARGAS